MKKRLISLMLTLSLLLGTVLGCFSLPVVAAAESGASVANITDVTSAVVGPELQVVVSATDAKSYKLYENGTCVAESEYPIIVYAGYDAAKTYAVSAVDENGNETAVTNIAKNDIAKPEVEEYHASNILAGKPFQMADYAQRWAHVAATVKDWNWMTDGDINTRYSVTGDINAKIDGVVELGGTYTLGELRLYNFNGSASHAGTNLVIEVYTDGKWVQAAKYDLAGMNANLKGSGQKNGYIAVDLFGYNGEAIRIVNDGMTDKDNCLSYWEITLSGVLLSNYSDYSHREYVKSACTESADLFDGLEFVKGPNNTTNWVSGGAPISNINDAAPGTGYKANGMVELDVEFDSDYVIIDTITVRYMLNTGGGNSHYIRGDSITVSVFFAGVWKVVYTETFTDNYNCEYLNVELGGVPAEKLRIASFASTKYINKDSGAVAYEAAVGINDINATGKKVNVPTDLVEKDNVLLGHKFVPTPEAATKVWEGNPYDNLTNGNNTSDRFATAGLAIVDATLDFGGVARLDELTIVYESAARSGVDLLVEVIYNGETCAIVDEDYKDGYNTRIFNMGGILAEKVRIYVSNGRAEGNCTSIREISCTGATSPKLTTTETHENILSGVTITQGPAATAPHAANYGYASLTDGIKQWTKIDNVERGRFSTATINGGVTLAVMDAIANVEEYLNLGELRIYDFNTNENIFAGTSLQIMLLVRGSWITVYDIADTGEIYAHRNGSYLSFDLGGINATQIRIIARQTTSGKSVSLFEIELSASWIGYADEKVEMDEKQDEVAEKVNEGNNVLLGLPEQNAKIIANGKVVSMNANHPLRYAFDGIVTEDIVDGRPTANRYATQGSMTPIKDADGNQIGAYYYLEIDLENATRLYTLSLYEWRSGSGITRSNKTSIEVKINGEWVKVVSNVSLSTDAKVDRTDFDLGGVAASGIRITFLNDYYEGSATATGLWPTPTLKEITCTGEVSYGDLLDAFNGIDTSTDGSEIFGLDAVKDQKLESLKQELVMAGATPAEILAKINEFNDIAAEFASGVTPVTDAYGDFKQANISLEGNIGFNFYGALDENVEEQFPNASVVVRYNTVLEGVVITNTEVRNLSDLAKDKNGRYIVDFDMAAAQMTDSVDIRLVLDGDNCGTHVTWSVKDYCDIILAGEYEQKLKDVVTAMLNYGAYAQSYFGYKTDDLAADLSDLGSITETAKPVVSGSVTGVGMSRWTLTLDSNVTMKLYFTLDGVNPDDLTVTVTAPDGSVTTVDELELVGSRYRVTINDITSGFLNDNYVVTITAGDETLTVTSSAMCYVSGILAMENTDPALVNLVTALKLYSVAADAYFGK